MLAYNLSAQGFKDTDLIRGYIDQHIKRLNTLTLAFSSNQLVLHINIKRSHTAKQLKDTSIFIEGSMILRVPNQILFIYLHNGKCDSVLAQGFDHLIDKLKKYQELHYSAHSQYPDHRSIRHS
jgi:hypothetical protein